MVNILYSEDGIPFIGQDVNRDNFETVFTAIPRSGLSEPSYVTTDPEVIISEQIAYNGYATYISYSQRLGLPDVKTTLINSDVVTLLPTGEFFKKVGEPLAAQFYQTGSVGTKYAEYDLSSSLPGFVIKISGRKTGTNLDAFSLTASSLIQGKSQGDSSQMMFTAVTNGVNASECHATVNNNSFFSSMDFTHVSFCRSGSPKQQYPVLLVGPRQILYAWHIRQAGIGENIIFRAANGAFQEATVVSASNLGNDIGVATLSKDIVGIPYAKVFGSELFNKINILKTVPPSLNRFEKYPLTGIILSHNPSNNLSPGRHGQLIGIGDFRNTPSIAAGVITKVGGSLDDPGGWFSEPYGGDSGSPVYSIVSIGGVNTPVLVTSLWTAAYGPNYVDSTAAIESALGITLQKVNLSEYPNL